MDGDKVTVIVLNYKTYSKTEECIQSLIKKGGFYNLIVIDNDNISLEFNLMKDRYKEYPSIYFISSNLNLGYAKGNNFGIKWAESNNLLGDYIAIVNNDIILSNDFSFDKLTEEYKQQTDIAVVSPKIIQTDTNLMQGPYYKETLLKNVFEALFPFFIPLRIRKEQKWRQNIKTTQQVYRTMGSFLIIKKNLFKQIGYFDENTFLGSEEDILAEKFRAINKYFYFSPENTVYHNHGFTTSTINSDIINEYFTNSKLYFCKEYLKYNAVQLQVMQSTCKIRLFWLSLNIKLKKLL